MPTSLLVVQLICELTWWWLNIASYLKQVSMCSSGLARHWETLGKAVGSCSSESLSIPEHLNIAKAPSWVSVPFPKMWLCKNFTRQHLTLWHCWLSLAEYSLLGTYRKKTNLLFPNGYAGEKECYIWFWFFSAKSIPSHFYQWDCTCLWVEFHGHKGLLWRTSLQIGAYIDF